MAFDLISIGDCVIDTYVPLKDAQIIEKDGVKLLCLPYGFKVPVEEGESMVAGNAANNAVGASRLKLKTAIYTNVGNKDDDESDDRIKAKFKKEGVDIRYIAETADLPSNHNIILSYQGERTILIHHQPWKFQLPDFDKTRWVYLTSLSPSYIESNVIDQLLNYIGRVNAKLAYQPGTFQIKQGIKKNAKIISACEIVILNKEESKLMLGYDPGENVSIKKLLKQLIDHGVRKVVITDGREGSYSYDGEKYFHLAVFPSELVEATGAGDAFATSTVAALMYGEELPQAMRWGTANASSVVTQIGAQRGLLSYNKMRERLKEYSKITPKEL